MEDAEDVAPKPRATFQLTRFVVLRLLGVVYAFAFWAFVRQGLPLVGHHGLLPADSFLDRVAENAGGRSAGFWELPTLFWAHSSDSALLTVAWIGFLLSLLVVAGFADALVMAVLWALYMSVVHVGQLFYGYGWEMQLLETGFLAIFLCPPLDLRPFPKRQPPEIVVRLFWWLAFRVMLGAGLIKMRGDQCWRDLTCLDYHFETQPIPNPLSPYFHFAPHGVHVAGVLMNHVAELLCPFLIFLGRTSRHVAAMIMLVFQLTLILSGNLSFLNWLMIVPILACFDDGAWARVLPWRMVARAKDAEPTQRAWTAASVALMLLIAVLSVEPVKNLLSDEQAMNTSFDPFELVNTYGAFGSVGKERGEIIFEGTRSATPDDPSAEWRPYEFVCKPGDPMRRPCVTSPYQPRIDWQIWFAAMSNVDRQPWAIHLVWKLLHNDAGALSLLDGNPYPEGPPKYIRAKYYRYRFAPLGTPGWWTREEQGLWMPAVSPETPELKDVVEEHGWKD
ncbi:MAG: lipase maturation factor family protein [Deltaproteobacteria bacterium]|nr:lipase maturation factor family protein [Deltaproteobacteria bacterium]